MMMVVMARMMMVARAGLVVMTWQRIRLGTNYQPLHCEDTDGKGQTQMKYKLKYKTTLEHTNFKGWLVQNVSNMFSRFMIHVSGPQGRTAQVPTCPLLKDNIVKYLINIL